MTDRIILSPPERRELKRMSRSRSARHEDVRRANILLNLASGASREDCKSREAYDFAISTVRSVEQSSAMINSKCVNVEASTLSIASARYCSRL